MVRNLSKVNDNGKLLVHSVEDITLISNRFSDGIEETAASVQQTSGNMGEINTSALMLTGLAEELNKMVEQFKVKE